MAPLGKINPGERISSGTEEETAVEGRTRQADYAHSETSTFVCQSAFRGRQVVQFPTGGFNGASPDAPEIRSFGLAVDAPSTASMRA